MFRHIRYAIFFYYFSNIVFILVAKISFKKVCKTMENNLTLKKVLLVCNRNAEQLRLVGATFNYKMASLRRFRKKNLIILKSLQKKCLPFIVLFVFRCWHLSCKIWMESVWKIVICSLSAKFFSILQQFTFLLSNN